MMSGHPDAQSRRRLWIAFVPVALFASLAVLFAKGLWSADPSKIPTALKDKPVPEFSLPPVAGSDLPGLASSDLKTGTVTVVNVWASWCVPCRQEHPLLMQLAADPSIRVTGINYKDKPENARRFLSSLGNPFAMVGADEKGSAAIDWGVYGVPETFIVDGNGIIRFKKIGPIDAASLETEIKPQIEAAKSAR